MSLLKAKVKMQSVWLGVGLAIALIILHQPQIGLASEFKRANLKLAALEILTTHSFTFYLQQTPGKAFTLDQLTPPSNR